MRPREAARYYGLGKKALYELLWSGQIRGVECGKKALVDRESADAFFAALPNAFITTAYAEKSRPATSP
jgi:excisionase family DNA binding protein